MNNKKTVAVRFTKDELRVVQFLVAHRNDKNSSNLFQTFYETIEDSSVGLKIGIALGAFETSNEVVA